MTAAQEAACLIAIVAALVPTVIWWIYEESK